MASHHTQADPVDLFVIGGGINGCGIARDAAGRGLSVTLAEMGDLASATSSGSTKLFHGGLRYLEYFEFGLVGKALKERETLLRAMPHISWPLRFVLPYHRDMRFESDTPASRLLSRVMPWMKGRRPAWLIRLGLMIYDTLGGRKILPATRVLDLARDPAGAALHAKFTKAFEYSDCWVEDSRLVVLNARDAQARGAQILTRHEVVQARRYAGMWRVTLRRDDGHEHDVWARMLVNASGPWLGRVIQDTIELPSQENVRLVRGSHIVTRKLYDHDKAYFLQGTDGRIIFLIPYETDFTLIGTTDVDHPAPSTPARCSDAEAQYLCDFASQYLARPVTMTDIVWRYSGVRPLYDDGAQSASAATRDYVLSLDAPAGDAPVLNVFGGKITTYRSLAEGVLAKLAPYHPGLSGPWTAGVALPGGDFPVEGVAEEIATLRAQYPFLNAPWATRLVKAYGTQAREVLGAAQKPADLGQDFGAQLYAREVAWLMRNEFARTAEDVVWRRSRLGLRLNAAQIAALDAWMNTQRQGAA